MASPSSLPGQPGLGARLVRAGLGSAGIRVAGMGFTFLIGVQLARFLGPEGFGIYGAVMAVTALLVVPAQLGLPQLITRELSTNAARNNVAGSKGVLVWYPALVAATSVLVAAAALAAALWWPGLQPPVRRAFCWGIVSVPLLAMLNLGIGALRGFHHVVAAQAFDALLRPLAFAALLAIAAAVFAGLDAVAALALQALAVAMTLAACAWHVLRASPRPALDAPAPPFRRELTKGAAPMLGTELLRVLDGQYPILLLGVIASLGEVGLFRVALAVAGFIGLPSTLVNLVIMSFVAQLHAEDDRARLQVLAAASAVAMFSVIGAIVIGLYLWGEAFIGLVFGVSFAPAWMPLMVMGLAYAANAFCGSAATILNMAGQERTVMLVHLVGPAVGIGLTLALYERFGILAPALAMLVAECIKGSWMAYAARRSLGIEVTMLSAGVLLGRIPGLRPTTSR